jgi:hypothetical protein
MYKLAIHCKGMTEEEKTQIPDFFSFGWIFTRVSDEFYL